MTPDNHDPFINSAEILDTFNPNLPATKSTNRTAAILAIPWAAGSIGLGFFREALVSHNYSSATALVGEIVLGVLATTMAGITAYKNRPRR